jgi:hypothetical protein|tara:strand:- start:438 stop:635 length:198 start_codon:yes stop_codon:yes gene_type:complete
VSYSYISKLPKDAKLQKSSIGDIARYDFASFAELQIFFLDNLKFFKNNRYKTKAIGKTIYVWRND